MKKKTILVVDDDATIRRVLTEFLEHLGYSAVAVEDGEQALAVAKSLRPHAILLDILLPGMSGIEALRRLQQVTPTSTVIMISGQTDHGIAKQALTIGAYDYVVKPLDFKYLKWILEAKIAHDKRHS